MSTSMVSSCATCEHRVNDLYAPPKTPSVLKVCLITLHFKSPISTQTFRSAFSSSSILANSPPLIALNMVLNNIVDSLVQRSHPHTFTTWSPCLLNPHKVAILTTASKACSSGTAPVFRPVLQYLNSSPTVQCIFFDYSILALAASSPGQKIACDVITLRAPNPGIAGAIGKRFGWAPKRSSLSAQMELGAPAAFSRPGDLIRDFWAWAELHGTSESRSSPRSNTPAGENKGVGLRNTNSDEKNMSLFFPEDEEEHRHDVDDEALIMIFQWSSHEAADRFKHPLQKSYGQNGQEVSQDLFDRHVAHPVRQLEGVGAQVDTLRLELRGVGEQIQEPGKHVSRGVRERSGNRTLGAMTTGLGERVSGLWR